MIDEIQASLEREFGLPVNRERAGRYIITLADESRLSVSESHGSWLTMARIDTDATAHAGKLMDDATWEASSYTDPIASVRDALEEMAEMWDLAEAKRLKAAVVAASIKHAISNAKASPEARALSLAGIRRNTSVGPWRAWQSANCATVGGTALGLRAMVERRATGYRASISALYARNFSEQPTDGYQYTRTKASRTHADPIVALHGAIMATLAKMVNPAAKCDRVQCLTEARDNLARWLPAGAS